jgi:type IV secretory pathway TrbF-like protein
MRLWGRSCRISHVFCCNAKIVKVEGKISSKDVVKAYDLVVDRQLEFLEQWEEIHGKQDES